MKDFFKNVLRYFTYFITIVLGIATASIEPLMPLLKRPVTAVALITAAISAFIGLTLVLRAMLGLNLA
jgi:hypothetical protein